MKAILHTREGFEKTIEIKDFTPTIRVPVIPVLTVFQKESDYSIVRPIKEFIVEREEKIFHYKEI